MDRKLRSIVGLADVVDEFGNDIVGLCDGGSRSHECFLSIGFLITADLVAPRLSDNFSNA